MKWEGPYEVAQKYNNGTFELQGHQGERVKIVNGNKLKLYHNRTETHLGKIQQVLAKNHQEDNMEMEEELVETMAVHLEYFNPDTDLDTGPRREARRGVEE